MASANLTDEQQARAAEIAVEIAGMTEDIAVMADVIAHLLAAYLAAAGEELDLHPEEKMAELLRRLLVRATDIARGTADMLEANRPN